MKKIISLILAFIFLFSLTACEGIGDDALYNETENTEEKTEDTYISADDPPFVAIEGLDVNACSIDASIKGFEFEYIMSEAQSQSLAQALCQIPFDIMGIKDANTNVIAEIRFGEDVFAVYEDDTVSCSVIEGRLAKAEGIGFYIDSVMAKEYLFEHGFSDSYSYRGEDGRGGSVFFSWMSEEAQKAVIRRFDGVVFDSRGEYETPKEGEVYYELTFKTKSYHSGIVLYAAYQVDANDRVFVRMDAARDFEYIGTMKGISDYMYDMFNPRSALKEETTETAEKNNYKSLHITVNNDKNYLSEDFPEVEVVSLSRLSYQISPRLWVLRFRCDTDEELARIMDELSKREDVEKITKAPTVSID